MRGLLGLSVGIIFVFGCGLENQHNLGHNPDFFGDGNNKGIYSDISSSCRQPFSVSLSQIKNMGVSPVIEFASNNQNAVEAGTLARDASPEKRCIEIKTHLSGLTIKEGGKYLTSKLSVEISFTLSDAERKQMALGKTVSSRPSRMALGYSDGSLNDKLASIDLRCTGIFSIACDAEEIDGQKECMSFIVSSSAQTCTFRALGLPFSFSDHRISALDISGDLSFSSTMGAQIKFGAIIWDGLY